MNKRNNYRPDICEDYTYFVFPYHVKGNQYEYVGKCLEFPLLSWITLRRCKSLTGIKKLVQEVVRDMKNNEEPLPQPLMVEGYD